MMDSSLSISILYKIISELQGKSAAREFVSTAVENAISEIQEENLEVTPDEIDRRLARMATDYKEVWEKSKSRTSA